MGQYETVSKLSVSGRPVHVVRPVHRPGSVSLLDGGSRFGRRLELSVAVRTAKATHRQSPSTSEAGSHAGHSVTRPLAVANTRSKSAEMWPPQAVQDGIMDLRAPGSRYESGRIGLWYKLT